MGWDYDVVIVGAGPGGSTAARFCAMSGLKTLLIEKERLPRYKPCGGCLSLKTVHLLDFDLSPILESMIYGAKFSYLLKDSFSIHSEEPIAYMVMRDRFDQFLIVEALSKGAELLEGVRVVRVSEEEKGVHVELAGGGRIRSHYLIGADGAESLVSKSFSLLSLKRNINGIAIQSEIPYDLALDYPKDERQILHLDFGGVPNGYGWVFPKREGLSVGIGGMFQEGRKMNPRQFFSDFLKRLNYLDERKVIKILGHFLPSFYDGEQKVARGNVLLVGDAAHLMDPLQGEGIYYAVRSGMLAAEAIIESKEKGIFPSDLYQKMVQLHIFQNLKWAFSFSRFVFKFPKLAYKTLRHYPELSGIYLQVLEGKETYQGFVSRVKERMRDFMKGRLGEKIRKAMAKT